MGSCGVGRATRGGATELVDIVPLALGTKLTLKAGCVLISDGASRVLVDPGCFATRALLEQALQAAAGIGVADIDVLFFTHLHFDHYNDLGFADVPRVLMPRKEVAEVAVLTGLRGDVAAYTERIRAQHHHVAPVFLRQFLRLIDDRRYDFARISFAPRLELVAPGHPVTPNLRVIDLPGHSIGQVGLSMRTRFGHTAVVADAALSAEDYRQSGIGHHLVVFDPEALLRTRAQLAGFDCIVPGHGAWFNPRTGAPVTEQLEECHV